MFILYAFPAPIAFSKEVCAEIDEAAVIAEMAQVRAFAGDRSVMRALHFFEENRRVEKQVKALKENIHPPARSEAWP